MIIMNKIVGYATAILLIIFTSFFIVRKLKKSSIPPIIMDKIALVDLNGKAIENGKFIGKPLVINFWGTWCGPCREELPNFETAQKKYGNKVNIILVSDESPETILKFKADNNYSLFYAQSLQHFNTLGLTSVPFTYFYDAKGKLIFKHKDELSEAELDELIKKLVE